MRPGARPSFDGRPELRPVGGGDAEADRGAGGTEGVARGEDHRDLGGLALLTDLIFEGIGQVALHPPSLARLPTFSDAREAGDRPQAQGRGEELVAPDGVCPTCAAGVDVRERSGRCSIPSQVRPTCVCWRNQRAGGRAFCASFTESYPSFHPAAVTGRSPTAPFARARSGGHAVQVRPCAPSRIVQHSLFAPARARAVRRRVLDGLSRGDREPRRRGRSQHPRHIR
jgi:hypothetical protein